MTSGNLHLNKPSDWFKRSGRTSFQSVKPSCRLGRLPSSFHWPINLRTPIKHMVPQTEASIIFN